MPPRQEDYPNVDSVESLFIEARKTADIIYSYIIPRNLLDKMNDPYHSDHGFPHSRRVMTMVSQLVMSNDELRSEDSGLMSFYLPLCLSALLHDTALIEDGVKRNHGPKAAIITHRDLKKHQQENPESISDEQIYATGFIIYYHSFPEKILSSDSFSLYNEYLGQNEINIADLKIRQLDREVLKRSAIIFALADKIDTLNFPSFSLLRSFQTPISAKRNFFSPLDSKPKTLEDELEQRISLGKGSAKCDFDRMLYEFFRDYDCLIITSNCPLAGNKIGLALKTRIQVLLSLVKAMERGEDATKVFVLDIYNKLISDYVISAINARIPVGVFQKRSLFLEDKRNNFIEAFVSKLKKEGDIFSYSPEERIRIINRLKQLLELGETLIKEKWCPLPVPPDTISYIPATN